MTKEKMTKEKMKEILEMALVGLQQRMMEVNGMIGELDLSQTIQEASGENKPQKLQKSGRGGKRKMSEEGRKAIGDASRKRWAKLRREQKLTGAKFGQGGKLIPIKGKKVA